MIRALCPERILPGQTLRELVDTPTPSGALEPCCCEEQCETDLMDLKTCIV